MIQFPITLCIAWSYLYSSNFHKSMDFYLIALSNLQLIELSVHAKGGENFQNFTRHTWQWDKCDIFIIIVVDTENGWALSLFTRNLVKWWTVNTYLRRLTILNEK